MANSLVTGAAPCVHKTASNTAHGWDVRPPAGAQTLDRSGGTNGALRVSGGCQAAAPTRRPRDAGLGACATRCSCDTTVRGWQVRCSSRRRRGGRPSARLDGPPRSSTAVWRHTSGTGAPPNRSCHTALPDVPTRIPCGSQAGGLASTACGIGRAARASTCVARSTRVSRTSAGLGSATGRDRTVGRSASNRR